jgi:hypothetical protein
MAAAQVVNDGAIRRPVEDTQFVNHGSQERARAGDSYLQFPRGNVQ